MFSWIRRRSLVEISLNTVFGVWVVYFIATGYIVPSPLVRHNSVAPSAESQDVSPAPLAPVELTDQES